MSVLDKLKELSVRILDKDNSPEGSGALYIGDDRKKAYVLTAAHVVFSMKEKEKKWIRLEFWSDDSPRRIKDVKIEAAIAAVEKPPEKRTWYAEDAAIIPIDIEEEWMKNLPLAKLAVQEEGQDLRLTHRKVTGIGYSAAEPPQEDSSLSQYATEYGIDSDCAVYTAWDHLMTCYLQFRTKDSDHAYEIGGMSGSILALAEERDVVLVGMTTSIIGNYALGKNRCVDLFHIKILLEAQGVTPRMAKKDELKSPLDSLKRQYGESWSLVDGSTIAGRKNELNALIQMIQDHSVINVWGMPGIGKTEVLHALGETVTDRVVCYLKYKQNIQEDQDALYQTIMEAENPIRDGQADSFRNRVASLKKVAKELVLVIDNFEKSHSSWKDLQSTALCQLLAAGIKLIFVRTCPLDGVENYRIDAPDSNALWRRYQEDVSDKIKEEDFKAMADLVGGHAMTVKLLAEYLKTLVGPPGEDEIQRIKTDIQQGRFFDIEVLYADKTQCIKQHLIQKFHLETGQKEIIQLLSYLPKGISKNLLQPAMHKKEETNKSELNERGKEKNACIKNGWLIEDDGVITVPPILQILYGDACSEACGFFKEIWDSCQREILMDKETAKNFSEAFSSIREKCMRKECCEQGKCWTYLPEGVLRQDTPEYAQEIMKDYQEHLNRDLLLDVYEYALIDALCDQKTDDRLFYAGNLVLSEAEDQRNAAKKPNAFYAAVAYNCGVEYKKVKEYKKAISFLEKALNLAESEEMRHYCYQSLMDAHYQAATMLCSSLYSSKKSWELESLFDHCEKAVKYAEHGGINLPHKIADCYYIMAKVSEKMDQLSGREITARTKEYAKRAIQSMSTIEGKSDKDRNSLEECIGDMERLIKA